VGHDGWLKLMIAYSWGGDDENVDFWGEQGGSSFLLYLSSPQLSLLLSPLLILLLLLISLF
jgi:hypothetical protein